MDFKTDQIFWNNYQNMKDANTIGADKYFHAKANCESAQHFGLSEALKLSTGREIFDALIKNPLKQIPLKDNIADCIDDYKVDLYGLIRGVRHPMTDCKELVKKYRPNGLNKKY